MCVRVRVRYIYTSPIKYLIKFYILLKTLSLLYR